MARDPKRRRIPWEWIGLGASVLFIIVAARILPNTPWIRQFNAWIASLGTAGIFLFILVYVVCAVLLGPAWLMTIGAGFIFGLVKGVAIVSVAATIAAALAFLIARYLARRRVERWAQKNEKFAAIDRAIAKKGWKIVLMLRLSPVFPYTISNYLYGLTGIRFIPYVLATFIGVIPMIALYTYIGVATQAAAGAGHERTVWEWIALGVGLIFTIAAAVLITRATKRELEKARVPVEEP